MGASEASMPAACNWVSALNTSRCAFAVGCGEAACPAKTCARVRRPLAHLQTADPRGDTTSKGRAIGGAARGETRPTSFSSPVAHPFTNGWPAARPSDHVESMIRAGPRAAIVPKPLTCRESNPPSPARVIRGKHLNQIVDTRPSNPP